jgi:hypothetical protein
MRKLVVVFAAIALVMVSGVAQAATKPVPVSITGAIGFSESGAGSGTFSATGPVCSSGTILQLAGLFVGWQSNQGAQILVRHEFTCGDGSGSFVLQLAARLDFATSTTDFTWTVLSGTGDYAKLHGTGSGTGISSPGGVVDTYTGGMHID